MCVAAIVSAGILCRIWVFANAFVAKLLAAADIQAVRIVEIAEIVAQTRVHGPDIAVALLREEVILAAV